MRHRILLAASLTLVGLAPARADTVVVTSDRRLDVRAGRMVDRPQIFVVTLLPGLIDLHVYVTSDPRYSGNRSLGYADDFRRQTFRAALEAGVKMVFGTDAGVSPNGDNAKQFATMVTWGMTPLQAIRAATMDAATALGRPADVGAIAVGRYGDLVGVVGDPLADVRVLESVAFVMKGGDVVKGAAR